MKLLFSILLAILCLPVSADTNNPESAAKSVGTQYRDITFSEALKAAKREKKMVFVDCYTSWCIPCAMMAAKIFPEKECGDYMNPRFVSVKFDMEKGEGKTLQQKWKCKAYPTFIVFNSDGTEVARLIGGSNTADEFLKKLESAIDPSNSITALQASYAREHNMQIGLKLIETMMANDMDVAETVEEVFDRGQDYERFNLDLFRYIVGVNGIRSKVFDKAMLYKSQWDAHLGREVVNRIIFDSFRTDMYIIAATKREHDWTLDGVRKAAMLTSLLGITDYNSQALLPQIALFIMEKDFDGLLAFYQRYVGPLPSNDSYKGILHSILDIHRSDMNEVQQAKTKEYYESIARSLRSELKQVEYGVERLSR